jgi:hypothetical protein
MRDVSTFAALLNSGEGIEPIMTVSFGTVTFADRDLYNSGGNLVAHGRIVSMGSLEMSQKGDTTGGASSLTVVLDDRDGFMKQLFDGSDMLTTVASVSQMFEGDDDSVLLFKGRISTPLVWDEGDRTLTVTIEDHIGGREIGYSIDMSPAAVYPQELIGEPWPMVFGTVHYSPCLRLNETPTGFTKTAFGIADLTLDSEIQALKDLLQQVIAATMVASLNAQDPTDPLDFKHNVQRDSTVQSYQAMQRDIQERINELQRVKHWQSQSIGGGSVEIIPTVWVMEPYRGLMRVGNNLFYGSLDKDKGFVTTTPVPVPGSPASQPHLREGFQFYNAGSQVVIAGPYPTKYVASVTPGTVLKVWAVRSFNGLKQMAEVPPSYYTIETSSLGNGLTATIVVLNQPLSSRAAMENEKTQNWENAFGKFLPGHVVNQIDWEDDLYVTFQSSVGPKPSAIMEWAVANFSDTTLDVTDKGAIDAVDMNFAFRQILGIDQFLAEVAYQAKAMIYLRDGVYKLVYLAKPPTSVMTITEDDVMAGSLKVGTTSIDELITRYVGTYRIDDSPFTKRPERVTVRYNIPKYGVRAEEHDFFCFNNWSPVQAAVTWWIIRKSQIWKTVSARLLINKLGIELFDGVTLDFLKPYVASGGVTGLVTHVAYDSANKYIDVEIWTPVVLGTMHASDFVWKGEGVERQKFWPENVGMAGGGGGSWSSPQMPKSNARNEPVGYKDVSDLNAFWTNDGPMKLQPLDHGTPDPETPYFAPQPMPTSKLFPTTPTPTTDPTEDYSYRAFPDIDTLQGTFPGKIVEKESDNKYKVDVFPYGLNQQSVPMTVKQLQIEKEDTIPPGTWVLVCVQSGTTKNGDRYDEKTMQVSIWLE